MDPARVLISAVNSLEDAALLVLDLPGGTYRTLLPYRSGGVHTTADRLYVVRMDQDKTRLEQYDREGLVCMRRVRHCTDTHSLTRVGEEIAVCSTGTNEVIFLDDGGRELRRWSPDDSAEGDSWHINSLAVHDGRLFVTCFGRFPLYRGWQGRMEGSGLLLDVEANRAILQGFSGPHDPARIEGGWVLNDAARSRTLLVPDGGPAQVIAELPGFARGLAVLPDVYVIGFSSHRYGPRQDGGGGVLVVDRRSHQVIQSIRLPYLEVGHIVPAPSAEVLTAVQRDQDFGRPGLLSQQEPVAEADRAGSLVALGPLCPLQAGPGVFEVLLRVTNRGRAVWSSDNLLPLFVAFQVLGPEGEAVFPEGPRTRLPIPVMPGKSLTFPLSVDLNICRYLTAGAAVKITLIQERVAWWEQTQLWTPAIVDLPPSVPTDEEEPRNAWRQWDIWRQWQEPGRVTGNRPRTPRVVVRPK
jgi:hypothetical protein